MIGYGANEGARKRVEALRRAGWRVMLTPRHPRPEPDLRFAIDNGAWSCHQQHMPFDAESFGSLVERFGCAADFVVLPDIVSGGADSLAFSVSWLPKLGTLRHLLLPVQDGMTHHEVGIVLRQNPKVGLFLGGSTEFKLQEMYAWGAVAHSWKRWYHVARVNSVRRVRLAAEAGADSFDGSSVTIFDDKLARLDPAARMRSLLSPAQLMGAEVVL